MDQVDLSGKRVKFSRHNDDWVGVVEGDSYLPGFLRVAWESPHKVIGHNRPEDLVPVEE